jgi:hypothetical protein
MERHWPPLFLSSGAPHPPFSVAIYNFYLSSIWQLLHSAANLQLIHASVVYRRTVLPEPPHHPPIRIVFMLPAECGKFCVIVAKPAQR